MDRTSLHDLPQTDGRPLYWRIASRLLGELRDGTVPPGEGLPGEQYLARHFEVSRRPSGRRWSRCGAAVWSPPTGGAAMLPGRSVEDPVSPTFPVGGRPADPWAGDRATVTWEEPPPEHTRALGLAPRRPTLVHRYRSAAPDGRSPRTAVS